MAKYPGINNGADLMTKYKGRADTLRLLGRLGFIRLAGRPGIAPKGTTGWDIGKPVVAPKEEVLRVNMRIGSICFIGCP